ncbi:hypothetical protein COU56_02085 [Candidatus Pacearchaeota archaeon CG10_big_fil_rev_8_21_14_0_10_31_9]|nr:MAG: hypothetical protein COU56_02085 [Candidatus Pacearchaeota archaeon CG10_big_fil_rev_8_21_14_0_10_31_9]
MVFRNISICKIVFVCFFITLNINFVLSNSDTDLSNNAMSLQVDVKNTKEFKVNFIPIDYTNNISNFIISAEKNIEFINVTYPLANGKFIYGISSKEFFSSNVGDTLDSLEEPILLLRLYRFSRLGGQDYDRVVGIVPMNWLNQHKSNGSGFTYIGMNSVLIEDNFRHGAAHEIGHTIRNNLGIGFFGLCDESNSDIWKFKQDLLIGLCPNGDSNPNDGELDSECQRTPNGCNITTLKRLVPWPQDQQNDEITMWNFMGDSGFEDSRWISEDSYNYLLSKFDEESSIQSGNTILISGIIYDDNSVSFDKFYILNENSFINETYSYGNYSITLKVNNSIFYNYEFEPIFKMIHTGGDTTDTNITPFVAVLPFADNVTQIIVQNSTTILAERNVSANTPTVSFNNSFQGESYNDSFMITWNADDTDGDNLTYAVLISDDGGNNFTTVALDIDETNLVIENSLLENGSEFKIKVLATDGVNTGEDISNFSFSIEPDPFIDLIYPEDDIRLQTNNVTFFYRTTVLDGNITNCYLFINGNLNLTNDSEIVQGVVMNFTQSFSDGEYNWTIQCVDTNNFVGESELYTLDIGLVIPEILEINVYPDTQEFLENVTINVTLAYPTDVVLVTLNITNPNGRVYEYYNLSNISFGIWGLNNFTDNVTGTYNFTFFAYYNGGTYVKESSNFMMVEEIINLTKCKELDKENTTYYLTKNILASGTCFNIHADNITLEGNSYVIYYAESSQGYGIYVDGYNKTKLKNIRIRMDNSTTTDSVGIYLRNGENHLIENNEMVIRGSNLSDSRNHGLKLKNVINSNVLNNTINVLNKKGYGVYLESSNGEITSNNKLINNTIVTSKDSGYGIYIWGVNGGVSEYSTILGNMIKTYGSTSYGVLIQQSTPSLVRNNLFENNFISTSGANSNGIKIISSQNNFFKNSNISSSKDNDVLISSGTNNTFLNTSYIDELISSGSLIRGWYLNVYVNNSVGNNTIGANVSGSDVFGSLDFSELTDSNGQIPTKSLAEYINNGGAKTYYTNYTINVTKANYENASQSANLTTNLNLIFTLESTILPNDTYKFYIKDSLGNNVSWFGSEGNIVLKGSCFAQSTCITNDGSSFIIGNSTDTTTAFINSIGDLCIEKGDCGDLSPACNNPSNDAFIIKNSSSNVAYIDYNGDLCLTGGLYENSNP